MPKRDHPIPVYLAAAALGLLLCLSIYDLPFLMGTSPFWQSANADQMQALTGWHGFARDAWRFPIFDVKTLRYPRGANIIFTDSIPLAALLAKPFVGVLPKDFHYFGWWFALCFALQAAGAVALLRAWAVRSWLALAAGALFALSMPAWLIRHHHMALCGQFLVLFAATLYARTQQREPARGLTGAWAALAVVALLVHVYLLAMVIALLFAAVAQRAWNHRHRVRAELPVLLAVPLAAGAGILVTAFVSGHFSGEAARDATSGFGVYSMNLLSPWYPQGSLEWPGPPPVFDATGGQYEGANYLGAGALLLIAGALLFARRAWSPAVRRNGVLVLMLLLLTAFALSNRVFLGDVAVLKYRVPHLLMKPVEIFRSSGRFFWPVAYVLVLGSVALIARERRRRPWLAALLVAAPLIQWIDTASVRDFPRGDTASIKSPRLAPEVWRSLIEQHRLVQVFPTFFCGPEPNHRPIQELQLSSARAGVPINTVFMARQSDDCGAEQQAADILVPGARDLVVYFPPLGLAHASHAFSSLDACRSFPLGIVCSSRFLDPSFAAANADLAPGAHFSKLDTRSLDALSVAPGQQIAVAANADASRMLGSGWYTVENDGAWMRGGRAWLHFRLGAGREQALTFHFRAKAFLSPKHPRRSLSVSLNGKHAADFRLDTWEERDRVVRIPPESFAAGGLLTVEFAIDPVASPAGDGVSEDPRELGIQLQRVWFAAGGAY